MKGYEKPPSRIATHRALDKSLTEEASVFHSNHSGTAQHAGAPGPALSTMPAHMQTMLQLQRTMGNQAVQRLLQSQPAAEHATQSAPRETDSPGTSLNGTPIQRQLWQAELRGKKPNKYIMLKAYDRWLDPDTTRPSGVITVEEALKSSPFKPKRDLENGEIFDDQTGEIITVATQEKENRETRQKTASKKRKEAKRRKDLSTGVGYRSKRLQGNAEKLYEKKRAREQAQEDTGLYHIGGDTDTEQFEDEGLHQAIIDRIENLHVTQTDVMKDSESKEELEWFKLEEEHRNQIEAAYRMAVKTPDEIYHSPEERPMYTASRLESAAPQKRPGLKEDPVHTGIGGPVDDLSHSIPWAQVPEHLRHAEEGGVNHPRNIPYENYVTNQVVNTAIERVGQTYLDQKKNVVKVVCRLWKDDHVDRSIHVYFVEDLPHPLVFATRNLGDKKPKRHKRGSDL